MQQRTKKGFTLIELLIVIAIIGLLATLAIVSLTTAQRKARDTKRVADIKQLQNAVELYYSENTRYPASDTTNDTWTDFGSSIGSYITNTPVDPNNTTTPYTYGTNTAGTEYFIGAVLEDSSHAALNGDDDLSYSASAGAGLTQLAGLEAVDSNDSSASSVTAYNCTDPTYCVSE